MNWDTVFEHTGYERLWPAATSRDALADALREALDAIEDVEGPKPGEPYDLPRWRAVLAEHDREHAAAEPPPDPYRSLGYP